jgi:hypothetical protein
VVLRARRGVGGDVPGPWQGRRQARIAQRLHVGELEPEPCFLGVSGGFHHLAKKTKISTMWKPRTLRRSVGSRPTGGQRSACTSSPRRPRTARWKGAGPVYVVSIRIIHNTSGFPVYSSTLISIAGRVSAGPRTKKKGRRAQKQPWHCQSQRLHSKPWSPWRAQCASISPRARSTSALRATAFVSTAGAGSTPAAAPNAAIGSHPRIAIGTERQGSPPWLPPATTAA